MKVQSTKLRLFKKYFPVYKTEKKQVTSLQTPHRRQAQALDQVDQLDISAPKVEQGVKGFYSLGEASWLCNNLKSRGRGGFYSAGQLCVVCFSPSILSSTVTDWMSPTDYVWKRCFGRWEQPSARNWWRDWSYGKMLIICGTNCKNPWGVYIIIGVTIYLTRECVTILEIWLFCFQTRRSRPVDFSCLSFQVLRTDTLCIYFSCNIFVVLGETSPSIKATSAVFF